MKRNSVNSLCKLSIIVYLTTSSFALYARQERSVQEGSGSIDNYIRVPDSLLQIRHPLHLTWRPGLGYIEEKEIPENWVFDREEFFKRYATLPLSETVLDLHYYYADYIIHLGPEEKQQELEAMKKAAHEYKNSRLDDEIRFLDAFVCYYEISDDRINRSWEVARRFEKEGKLLLAVRLKTDLIIRCREGDKQNYYIAFRIADELLEELEQVTDDEFPRKRHAYSEIGHLHYNFRDYETAVPILEKALTDTKSSYFFEIANLRARNTLAVYYHTSGDLEKTAYYYHSILNSPEDTLFLRQMFDAIALTGLGRITAGLENYEGAIRLFKAALPMATKSNDYSYAVGILADLGKCYLKLGELNKTRDMIDTMQLYKQDTEKWVLRPRYRDIYSLINKYYIYKGDIARAETYADSIAIAEKSYEEDYNVRILLRTRQELLEVEKAVRDQKIDAQRKQLMLSTAIIILSLAALSYIIYLYRKRNAAYKALVQKSMQWAANTEIPETNVADSNLKNDTTQQDQQLLQDTHRQISEKQLFKDYNLTLDILAEIMGVNRTVISRVVNTTGKNFNQFINEYRIKEAVRVLSSHSAYGISLDELYELVGFNSRTSFYRAFKQNTGLTPTEFRNHHSQ